MSSKQPLVGFDRYIEKAWMDKTAEWVVQGKTLKEVNTLIDEYLSPFINGDTSKRKTKNVLSSAWVKGTGSLAVYKIQGVEIYKTSTVHEKLAVHYGMCIASFPFFLSLGKILGRLFKLQDEVTNAEFYRRVIETLGDRDSIKRAAARYLQSMVQWGLLEISGKATVKPSVKIQLTNSDLITWLYASILFTCGKDRLSIDDITSDPVWFPFEIPHGNLNMSDSTIVEIVHQGVGSTLVGIIN